MLLAHRDAMRLPIVLHWFWHINKAWHRDNRALLRIRKVTIGLRFEIVAGLQCGLWVAHAVTPSIAGASVQTHTMRSKRGASGKVQTVTFLPVCR